MKLSVVIPCLNERQTIKEAVLQCVDSLRKSGFEKFEVIVADNGSTDGSQDIVRKIGKLSPIFLIEVPVLGYGAALHFGILEAKYEYVLFADADLSYSFKQIALFKNRIPEDFDLVLGSRFKGEIMPGSMPFLHKYLGTPILTFLIRTIYKIKTTDCNSGMRMVKKTFYEKINMKNSGMEWASELLVKTAINKGKYAEVPIRLDPDKRNRKPHLNSWIDGWRHLKVIVLLKPSIFLYLFLISFVLGFILFFSSKNIHFLIIFTFIGEFILFSYLALKKMEFAITKKCNLISDLLNKLPLVGIGISLMTISFFSPFVFMGKYMEIKYLLLFESLFYGIWLFFIETIKTHMINLLPEKSLI